MMAKVKNKLRQPLAITTPDGEVIHFLARETKEVKDSDLSDGQLKNHVENGNLVVIRLG